MTNCSGLGFKEVVKCTTENQYKIAWGWVEATGRTWTARGGSKFPYTLPDGWEYDPRYIDKWGKVGSHGGCKQCCMTRVHLRSLVSPDDPCKNVSCPDKCIGVDKYDQVCENGICVRGKLIETNSVHCGYTPEPTPDPTPTPTPTPTPSEKDVGTMIYIAIGAVLLGAYLIMR